MLLTTAEMKALEARAFAEGVSAETLMEEAGAQTADVVRQFFPVPGRCVVFFGKGHNGGDALVAARHLAVGGWRVDLRAAFAEADWSQLTARKHREVLAASPGLIAPRADPPPLVVLDGLLGIGAGGALREPVRAATREINQLRQTHDAHVFALDLPTGLDADTGEADPDAVVADFTLTIGFAKPGLLDDAAAHFVGRLAVLPLAELSARRSAEPADAELAVPAALAGLLPRRSFDTHKGDCGRVGIVAGSAGLAGAARMAAEACLHAGAGLVTLYVPSAILPLVAPGLAPEIMVRGCDSLREVAEARHDVLAIGPGLGRDRTADVLQLIEHAPQPMVIDADALNILADHLEILRVCAGPRLLTPHPGEMARLVAEVRAEALRDSAGAEAGGALQKTGVRRVEIVTTFTTRFPITLLLKGARTLVGERGRPLSYNTTGHPGMASGGMGDVLTGVCAALAGQGLALYDAARLGAWTCGRAAELAIYRGEQSAESLSATHVIAHLGRAFRALCARGW